MSLKKTSRSFSHYFIIVLGKTFLFDKKFRIIMIMLISILFTSYSYKDVKNTSKVNGILYDGSVQVIIMSCGQYCCVHYCI